MSKHHLTEAEIPCFFQSTGCDIWDQTYRSYREMILQNYEKIKGYKAYWVGSILLAQALSDHLKSLGLIEDKDYHIITYGVFTKTDRYQDCPEDRFSVIGYYVETAADKICELSMNLLESPEPRKAAIPVIFHPSAAFGGNYKQTII